MSGGGELARVLAGLEAELGGFWAEPEAEAGGDAAAPPKVRAATLNLVRVEALRDLDAARNELDALSLTHPGRSFLLTVDPELPPWEARAEAHAACRLDGEGTPICHDRAEIAFGLAAAPRAASVVLALALPEVPIALEVGASAPAPVVAALAPRAGRVVVDTAKLSLERALEVLRIAGGPVGDRAFFRSEELRAAVARTFERSGLSPRQIRRLDLEARRGAPEPALLVGWFASRLGWTFWGRDAAERPDGGSVAIEVRAAGEAGEGLLLALRLGVEEPGAGEPASLGFELHAGASEGGAPTRLRVRSRTASGERCRDVPIRFEDEVSALVRALAEGPADAVYRGALEAAVAWRKA